MRTAAARLSAPRQGSAAALGRLEALLPDLGLPGGIFEVGLGPFDAIAATGAESVEFRVALNVGLEARPLARTASGGELSRVMLALKSILARLDRIPTLVFDEVDTGISGTVALKVGDACAGWPSTIRCSATPRQIAYASPCRGGQGRAGRDRRRHRGGGGGTRR